MKTPKIVVIRDIVLFFFSLWFCGWFVSWARHHWALALAIFLMATVGVPLLAAAYVTLTKRREADPVETPERDDEITGAERAAAFLQERKDNPTLDEVMRGLEAVIAADEGNVGTTNERRPRVKLF